MGQRVEAGSLREGVLTRVVAVPAQGLEQGVARRHPLQVVRLRRLAVGGQPGIPDGEFGEAPVLVALESLQPDGRPPRLEGVGEPSHRLEGKGRILGRLPHEPRNRLRDDPALFRAGAALDEQVEVQLLGRQPLKRRLADRPEVALVHVPEDTLLKIGLAEPSSVVVPEHPFDPRGGQNLSHHVE